MKKTRSKKSRDTLPLSQNATRHNIIVVFFELWEGIFTEASDRGKKN
jgi:hypothetical protein